MKVNLTADFLPWYLTKDEEKKIFCLVRQMAWEKVGILSTLVWFLNSAFS
ncbi:hypothetical protein [Tychonema sp. BBK16]